MQERDGEGQVGGSQSAGGLHVLRYDGVDSALMATGGTAAAVALALQPSLTHISLPRNDLADQGAWAIASAVLVMPKVSYLDLEARHCSTLSLHRDSSRYPGAVSVNIGG